MLDLKIETVARRVEEQASYTGAPPDFPPLPEVSTARYYDPAFAALEREHVWLKSWLMAGHVSELSEPGAYKLFERLGRSVIISRGKDEMIRAFHNSCRHRNSAIVLEAKGKTGRFVCPYHGWTYAHDGRLLAIPEERQFPCLDKDAKGLVPVRCETWRGLIFITFDPDAEALEDFLAPIVPYASSFPFEKFVVKGQRTFQLGCNWKVGIDNTLETYHVNVMHPETIAPFMELPSFTVGLLRNGLSWFAARKKSATILAPKQQVENVAGSTFADYNICLKVFPNNFYVLDATGFVYHTYWPDGPGRSVVEFTQMGLESDPVEYHDQMFEVMEPVLQEDWRLFPRMQRSMETGASRSIPLGYQERAIYWLNEEIDRKIGSERVPEDLRIQQILSPFSES